MVNHPKLLLADEPTGALDSKSGKQVLELFESLNESGVTVVVITHDRKVAEQAKRIVHIIDGEITEEGQEAGNEKEKRIKIIIIAVLVVAVAAGSITGVVYYRNSKGLASVMSVSMISTTNDYTSMTSEGMVCDDACQTINLKDGQKVTEVYVTKDQQVKAGDKLLAYDVTSLLLSVEMKQLEIQSLENQLASEKQKLDKLKNTKPVEKQPETPVIPEPQPDTQPSAPDEQHDVISDLSEAKGSGTEDDPYVFTCTEASYVSGELLNTLSEKSAVARFVIGDADAPDMELIVRGDRLGRYDESDEIKLFLAGTTTAGEASDDTEGSEPSDTKTDSATEQTAQTEADTVAEEKTYTADELKDAIKEQTRSVADVDLQKENCTGRFKGTAERA